VIHLEHTEVNFDVFQVLQPFAWNFWICTTAILNQQNWPYQIGLHYIGTISTDDLNSSILERINHSKMIGVIL